MAQKVAVTFTDDLDGSKAAETVAFALDGASYEIDLSARNAKSLRKALAEFQAAARSVPPSAVFGSPRSARPRTTRPRRTASSRTTAGSPAGTADAPASSAEVRAWAAANGVAVPSRGRVPDSVRKQYAAAQAG